MLRCSLEWFAPLICNPFDTILGDVFCPTLDPRTAAEASEIRATGLRFLRGMKCLAMMSLRMDPLGTLSPETHEYNANGY